MWFLSNVGISKQLICTVRATSATAPVLEKLQRIVRKSLDERFQSPHPFGAIVRENRTRMPEDASVPLDGTLPKARMCVKFSEPCRVIADNPLFVHSQPIRKGNSQIPVPISVTSDLRYTDSAVQVPIFHLHGSPYNPSPSPIVITQNDYARYQDSRRMVWNRLKNECATSTILYIGYSGRDPNWQMILDETAREFFPSETPQAYRIDPYANEIDVELDRARRIETLVTDLSSFKGLADVEIGECRKEMDTVNNYKDKIPGDLQGSFAANPAGMLRLLSSWEYVNAAPFSEAANVNDFLKGSKPNWSLVAQDRRFVRVGNQRDGNAGFSRAFKYGVWLDLSGRQNALTDGARLTVTLQSIVNKTSLSPAD
jgi:hypothetical protein